MAEMLPKERQNAARYTLGEGIWGLGMGFIAPLTVMPLLLRELGAGPVELGLFYSMASAGFLLTQPFGLFISRHGAGKKSFMLYFNASVTLPVFLFMAAILLFLGGNEHHFRLLRTFLLSAFSLRMLSIGLILPIWQDWVYGLFQTQNRGLVTGLYAAFSALGVMAGTFAASYIRQTVPFPNSYVVLFLAASFFFALSFTAFSSVEQGIVPIEAQYLKRPGLKEIIHRFSLSLRDTNFLNYLIGRLLLTAGGVAIAFYALYFQGEAGGSLSESTIIALGAFIMLPQAVSSYWLGQIGDRRGHRWGVVFGAFAQVASIVVVMAGSGIIACLLSFLLLGMAYAAGWVSHQNFIYETCPHDNRLAHITISSLVLSPLLIFMPIGAGSIVSAVGIKWTMAICLFLSIIGALYLLFFVDEPRLLILGRRRKKLPSWLLRQFRKEGEKTIL